MHLLEVVWQPHESDDVTCFRLASNRNLPPEIQPMVPGLLVVFILGIVLSTFEFMFAFMHKATPPVVRCGDVCCSTAVRSEKHDNQ